MSRPEHATHACTRHVCQHVTWTDDQIAVPDSYTTVHALRGSAHDSRTIGPQYISFVYKTG